MVTIYWFIHYRGHFSTEMFGYQQSAWKGRLLIPHSHSFYTRNSASRTSVITIPSFVFFPNPTCAFSLVNDSCILNCVFVKSWIPWHTLPNPVNKEILSLLLFSSLRIHIIKIYSETVMQLMECDVPELLGIVRPVYIIFPLTGKSFLLIAAASTSAAAGLPDCLIKVLGRLPSDCCQLMSATPRMACVTSY